MSLHCRALFLRGPEISLSVSLASAAGVSSATGKAGEMVMKAKRAEKIGRKYMAFCGRWFIWWGVELRERY